MLGAVTLNRLWRFDGKCGQWIASQLRARLGQLSVKGIPGRHTCSSDKQTDRRHSVIG